MLLRARDMGNLKSSLKPNGHTSECADYLQLGLTKMKEVAQFVELCIESCMGFTAQF